MAFRISWLPHSPAVMASQKIKGILCSFDPQNPYRGALICNKNQSSLFWCGNIAFWKTNLWRNWQASGKQFHLKSFWKIQLDWLSWQEEPFQKRKPVLLQVFLLQHCCIYWIQPSGTASYYDNATPKSVTSVWERSAGFKPCQASTKEKANPGSCCTKLQQKCWQLLPTKEKTQNLWREICIEKKIRSDFNRLGGLLSRKKKDEERHRQEGISCDTKHPKKGPYHHDPTQRPEKEWFGLEFADFTASGIREKEGRRPESTNNLDYWLKLHQKRRVRSKSEIRREFRT